MGLVALAACAPATPAPAPPTEKITPIAPAPIVSVDASTPPAPSASASSSATPTAPTPPNASTCNATREVTARIEIRSRSKKDSGSFVAAVLIDPSGKSRDLFETPFPYNCSFNGPFGGSDAGSDPFTKQLSCAGDDGYGSATITSLLGHIRVDAHAYSTMASTVTFDIALGACERARIVVPSKLPSAH